jgi:hypothetical protein
MEYFAGLDVSKETRVYSLIEMVRSSRPDHCPMRLARFGRVSVILCKQVSVSLPFERSSHDDHDIDT